MLRLVVIDKYKQALLDRLLGKGVAVQEISRLIGISAETLRRKLLLRRRGDPNWHNRDRVDLRGVHLKGRGDKQDAKQNEIDAERDDRRIQLFQLTKFSDGVTVQQAARLSGYSESVCQMELDDFCKRPRRSDIEAICRKSEDGRYFELGRQTEDRTERSETSGIKIIDTFRGRR